MTFFFSFFSSRRHLEKPQKMKLTNIRKLKENYIIRKFIKWREKQHENFECENVTFSSFSFKGRQVALPKMVSISSLTYRKRRTSSKFNTTNEKLFQCTNGCGRQYKLSSSLHRHLTFECGKEKEFFCGSCSKAYTRKESLKVHMLNHHKKDLKGKILVRRWISKWKKLVLLSNYES